MAFYERFVLAFNVVHDTTYLGSIYRHPAYDTHLIFEGAQGVLLDEHYGFDPHTTWSATTDCNAWKILEEQVSPFISTVYNQTTTLGLVRAYHTRHGAGPFPSYDVGLDTQIQDVNNPTNPWQGDFKVGWFDLTLADYALQTAMASCDGFVVSCLDQLRDINDYCVAFAPGVVTEGGGDSAKYDVFHEPRKLTQLFDGPFDPNSFLDYLESDKGLGKPIKMVASGPTAKDRVET